MKKIIFTFLLCFMASYGSAQHTLFRKIVENKYHSRNAQVDTTTRKTEIVGTDNLSSKGAMERLLFGKTNGNVEFFVDLSPEGASGLRIIKDSTNASFLLDIKRITNWEEVEKQVAEEFPSKGYSGKEIDAMLAKIAKMSEEEKEQSAREDRDRSEKRHKEKLRRYQIDTLSVPVTDLFAEKLYRITKSVVKLCEIFANSKKNILTSR